jgi:ribonuclease R
MELSINALLANFTDDKLVAPKVLEKKLGCEDESSLRRLQIALDALEKVNILVKERGKYRRVQEEGIVEGRLRCSSKGFCFAIQDLEGTEDIYVRENQLSTAWNGDRVLVKVTKEGRRRRSPEGEVRLILERANPSVLARVKRTNGNYRAVPLDDRLLFELELQPNQAIPNLESAVDQLVHVEIVRYPLGQSPPIGKVVQILGNDAQSAADADLICCKYDLPRSFSDSILQATKSLPAKVRKIDLKKRLDLRDLLTVTIDRSIAGTQQVDDAISLEKTAAGDWRLGVHVADVSHYLASNSILDRNALKRGLSVYLEEMVLPLLPPPLDHLCALLPEQDRLGISVLLTLSPVGEVLEFEIQPTVIRVDYSLTYQQVQTVLERHDAPGTLIRAENSQPEADLAPVFEIVDQMQALSQVLRQQRQQQGAFELSLPEAYAHHFDDEGHLGVIVSSLSWTARTIVEEFMVLANQTVASHLKALELPAIYRVQPTPDLRDVQELMKLASHIGIELVLAQEDAIHSQDYQSFTQKFAASDASVILTQLLLSTLKPASYSITAGPHFGLGLEQGYVHFTSPLRRYADRLTHRVLHAVFEQGRDRRTTRAKERVNLRHSACHGQINWNVLPPEAQRDLETDLAAAIPHLNEREKVAQQAEQELAGLKKAKQIKERIGEVFQGLITGIQSYGFFVQLEDLLVEGLVHVSSLKDDWYEYRSRQQTLIGRKSRRQYRLGDRVEVQVKSVDYYRQQIDLVVVGGGSEALDDDSEEPAVGEAFPEGIEVDFQEEIADPREE